MRVQIRIGALLIAIALIGYGLFQPIDEEVRWLIFLWSAAPFLGIAAWFSREPMPRGLNRNVHHLGMVIAIGFVLLSMQLLRQQMVQARAIYNRVHMDPETGQVTSNVRPVLASQRVIRGKIFDRNETLLVTTEVVEGGFAKRLYIDQLDAAAFSNIVGFFSTRYGQSGLEATYSDYLSGDTGSELARIQNDLLGHPQVGNNIHLTINAHLQAQASGLLGGRKGSVVVLDPKTGAVLAMVSSPGYDPRGLSFDYAADDWEQENARISAYWQHINSDAAGQPLLNRPAQGQYPPGSTFKTVTAVGTLEHPAIGEPNNIRCFNELQTEVGAPPVVNAVQNLASLTGDPSNLERVYAYSCNVAFAQYALRLGPDLLAEQAAKFDIYEPQNAPPVYRGFTDLPTVPSRLYVQSDFLERKAALADTGYGQGQLLVTPLQMAMVAASIANDGVMMRPYLVERIERPDDGGQIFQRLPEAIRETMSSQTAAKMRDNMEAVGRYGFGKDVNVVPGVMIGGKSGTGEHVPGATPHAWFIAIAPVDNPRYAVCVMLESGGEGSTVAARLAGQVIGAAIQTE